MMMAYSQGIFLAEPEGSPANDGFVQELQVFFLDEAALYAADTFSAVVKFLKYLLRLSYLPEAFLGLCQGK